MRRSGSARAPTSSSSERSESPPRRPKKRARSVEPIAASPARGGALWRESRGANGQVVLSLESDESDEDDGSASSADEEKRAARLRPPKRTAAPAVVTPRGTTTAPVVYCVDSDSDEEEDDEDGGEVEVVERVSPSEDVGTTAPDESEHEKSGEENEDEEEEDESEDEEAEEEEEAWEPAAEDTEETLGSEEHDDDDEEEESDEDEEEEDAVVSTPVRPRRSITSDATERVDASNADAVSIKRETLTPVKPEPTLTQAVRIPPPSPVVTTSCVEVPYPTPTPTVRDVTEPVPVPEAPLFSISQIEHESPPIRMRQPVQHPHRHPRAARRSTVRRRRLDPDHAGILLFDGPQYAPSAGVVKNLIEFIARTVGPMTGHERRWIDYVLLAKLNESVANLSNEVFSRHSEWMKITLGAGDETRRDKHHVQREPLLALPIRYTVRPPNVVMPKAPAPSNGKAKTKNATTSSPAKAAQQKQKQRAADTKWLEKRASELQSGEKQVKSETPRRRVSVGIPPQSTGAGPFSPTSSTTSSASSRARRAQRGGSAVDTSTHDYKRRRTADASPLRNGMYSPSTASTSTATTAASSPWPSSDFVDLANDEPTTGRNRSMPNEWNPEDARVTPPTMRPAAMNPLFTMPLSELKAHINSVRRDGRARSFEKPLEILHKIMHHPRNRETFNSPVDPVALNLPTYFDVIKKPMDLGTIKIRLEEAAYVEQDDFVADVRLVFENAMRFNAPNHSVHVDASVLLNIFEDLLHGGKHDRSLKRRAPPSNSDRHACRGCLGRSCVMCDQGCLEFAQPHLVCTGSCGVDLRKGSIYFTTRDGTRVWCAKCRIRHVRTISDVLNNNCASNGGDAAVDEDNHAQGSSTKTSTKKKKKPVRRSPTAAHESETGVEMVYVPGELIKKKCELDVEPWVKCSRCLRWLHQVCGLYNPVYGAYTPEHEYQCPLCVWKLRAPTPPLSTMSSQGSKVSLLNETGTSDLPAQQYESSCHQIPTCELSTFIEAFLRRGLRDMGELLAATDLHVRVLAFPQERVVVSDRLTKTFDENAMVLQHASPDGPSPLRFPCEIPYTSRGIYLFQRHEGVDVALFTLFVQEFGDDCPLPSNRRSVYVAYLDSIRYLTPPSARTASYHLIMMAYFDYIRRHGFERVHIWSCPPQKRISYVFWCRPSFQKTPSAEHLRAWYRRLLTKAKDAGIVQSWTTTYDQYFSKTIVATATAAKGNANGVPSDTAVSEGSSTVATRGTAARSIDPKDHVWPTAQLPPFFDGDFLPAELDRILGRLAARNGKFRRGSIPAMTGGKSSSVGSTGGKFAVGEFVERIKEERRAATGATVVAQAEFKVREIFDRLQHAVQRLKNDLLVVDLVVMTEEAPSNAPPSRSRSLALSTHVPSWWQHVPRLFGSRFMFHQLCASATYQFDTLRRAKHSTMMLLHHFKNESVRQLNVFCSECFLLITHADFWHCPSCVRFALCDLCHHRDGSSHMHKLTFGGGFAQAAATSAETSAEVVAEAVEEANAATALTTLGGDQN